MKVTRLLLARYGFSPENHHRQSNIRLLVSIACCMCAMLVVLSAMHALAMTRIESIRTFESFDWQVPVKDLSEGEKLEERLNLSPKLEAFVVAQEPALASGSTSSAFVKVRYLDPSNPWFSNLSISGDIGWMISPLLAWKIGSYANTEVEVSTLKEGKQARVVPKKTRHLLAGTFSSGDMELDGNYLLAPLVDASSSCDWFVAVVTNLPDSQVKRLISEIDPSLEPQSFKELNASLYGALVLEQMVVRFVFLFLLCIILLSVRRNVRALVQGKRKEIGTLLILGLPKTSIILVFLGEALFASLLGIASGVALGSLVIHLVNHFSSYSYMSAVLPSLTLNWPPAIGVGLFVLAGTLCMAFLGMRKTVSLSLMEMLRDE